MVVCRMGRTARFFVHAPLDCHTKLSSTNRRGRYVDVVDIVIIVSCSFGLGELRESVVPNENQHRNQCRSSIMTLAAKVLCSLIRRYIVLKEPPSDRYVENHSAR